MLINDILPTLKEKFGLPYSELERIIDSQFKVTHIAMEAKEIKSIKWANLGKIKPSSFLIANHEKFSKKV